MAKIKRSQLATYVDTSTTTGTNYVLLGVGVTAGKVAMNPEITTETYIHEDTATKTTDSYAPSMPVEMYLDTADPVSLFVDGIRQLRKVGADAETDIVHVNKYQSTNSSGWYPAERQTVSISVEDNGGDGGVPIKLNFTFNYKGNGSSGYFDVSSSSFYAN